MQSTGSLSLFAQWAVALMEGLGSIGAGVAVAAENLFPPIPSEVILPLAGFTASRGSFTLWEVLLWATAGSVVGALILYGLGAWLGRRRMRAIAARVPLVKLSDVDRAEAWFERHGGKAVFVGRMIPIVRSLISIPAGVERMPVGRFLLLTTAGSAVWNAVFVCAGYFLGESWPVVEEYADVLQLFVIAAVALALVLFVVVRLRQRVRGTMES